MTSISGRSNSSHDPHFSLRCQLDMSSLTLSKVHLPMCLLSVTSSSSLPDLIRYGKHHKYATNDKNGPGIVERGEQPLHAEPAVNSLSGARNMPAGEAAQIIVN